MVFALKRDVAVARQGPDEPSAHIVTLDAGTELGNIDEAELAQLAPDHFHDPDGDPDARPDDWRTNKDTLAHDARQAKLAKAEAREIEQRREAARADADKADD